MNQVLVYSPQSSVRLTYALKLFSVRLELNFRHTDNLDEFKNATSELRINYSKQPIGGVLQIIPVSLLFENGIRQQSIACSEWHSLPCFFVTDEENDAMPFDVFAAAFYLVTRYEEYICTKTDNHGRFPCSESLAFRQSYLQRPIVDLWAFELLKMLNPNHRIQRRFELKPTIDVDNFYKYRRKGIFGSLFLFAKGLLKKDFDGVKARFDVLLRKQDDPFFNFEAVMTLHKQFCLMPQFFFHVGGNGRFDKKMLFPTISKRYDKVIRQIATTTDIGIHPSYKAAFSEKRFLKEKQRLQTVSKQTIVANRFHFLRFRLPESYRMLLRLGIESDYSMLYADEMGFRAGTSLPFPFFDLEKNEETALMICPVPIMDATLLKPHQCIDNAAIVVAKMLNDVKRTHGTFITLFHNEHLANNVIRNFYEAILKQAKQLTDEDV